jgi:hypothetical protein
VSRLALTPTNVPASATAPTIPTLRAGDLYFNTTTGLMAYDGTNWNSVATQPTVNMVDAGVFDSIAPYQGGSDPTISSDQTLNGGTP